MAMLALLALLIAGLVLQTAVNRRYSWEARGRVLAGPDRPRVMGIVNVTPDSFSDGGRLTDPAGAAQAARQLVDDGADLLDVGGESSRPGAQPIALDDEIRRVIPAVEALVATARVPISVDTTKAEVARRALAAGASVVNDITALAGDPGMVGVVAEAGAAVVLMHMKGSPQTMQAAPRYDDVVAEVHEFLARRVEAIEAAGIARARIAIDPGIGFGKTFDHNLRLLQAIPRFASLGCTVLVGASRKGFLGTLTGRAVSERMVGSVVASLAAIEGGAGVVRVHDVGAMVDAIKVWSAVRAGNSSS